MTSSDEMWPEAGQVRLIREPAWGQHGPQSTAAEKAESSAQARHITLDAEERLLAKWLLGMKGKKAKRRRR